MRTEADTLTTETVIPCFSKGHLPAHGWNGEGCLLRRRLMAAAGMSGLLTGSPGQFGVDGADVRQDRHAGG